MIFILRFHVKQNIEQFKLHTFQKMRRIIQLLDILKRKE